ncbi:hypothetical protein CYMTET_9146 [Cymbomonas tetramitiformis]|uniref:Uncharacterized protein n=1 Tax=Cymbomonas tetramitiformis TaxID=36881 RepID=A0AAE0LFS8_9CHLO|nr:hypothetical protein CYMTET_9146 [Cymbomonas tetramitiformis]
MGESWTPVQTVAAAAKLHWTEVQKDSMEEVSGEHNPVTEQVKQEQEISQKPSTPPRRFAPGTSTSPPHHSIHNPNHGTPLPRGDGGTLNTSADVASTLPGPNGDQQTSSETGMAYQLAYQAALQAAKWASFSEAGSGSTSVSPTSVVAISPRADDTRSLVGTVSPREEGAKIV